MCDIFTEADNAEFLQGKGSDHKSGPKLNRRNFTQASSLAALMTLLPATACAQTVQEKYVDVPMADGVSDCFFVTPAAGGQHPAILMWPDIKGLRPGFELMGRRLAENGYAVLVVNPFYRDSTAPVAGDNPDFGDPDIREFLISMARKLTQEASLSDARDYIAFLDAQSAVDTGRKIGTCGYCMGGPLIMRTAAARPDRIGAAASFHGGGLATDRPDSPHLLIPQTTAQVLHAVAENDNARDPEAKDILKQAYAAVGLAAEIEVYKDTLHGWCPPDSPVYHKEQAQKAWDRMLALYERALV